MGLSPQTAIELPVTRELAELYVGNEVVPGLFEPFRVWGLCSRVVDVARVDSGAEARAAHGLAEVPEEFPVGDGLFVLRFLAGWPGLFRAARAPAAIPEYWMDLAEIPIGAELWHLAEDGSDEYEQKVAHFAGRHSGWQAYPVARERGLVPSAAAEKPASSVHRGLFATHQGAAYPADFGPDAGELTAYQTAQDGSVIAHKLTESQCDEIEYRRVLTTWRGLRFELLAAEEQNATLVHITGDAQQATELGLTPAGRHAWRVQVPKSELETVTEETQKIG